VLVVREALQESDLPTVTTAPTAHEQMEFHPEPLRQGAPRAIGLNATDLSATGEQRTNS